MLWLKYLHVAFVITSLCGFLLRFAVRLRRGRRLGGMWRIAPHVIDTGLLVTGLWMALRFRWSPLEQPWLMAKLAALAFYIVLGAVALRRGAPMAAVAAVAIFGYIVAVAVTKSPMLF